VTLAADSARADARVAEQAATRGDKLGPLHGLPIGIKDIVATANIRTTYGCPLYADNVPTEMPRSSGG
jgi:Asp-tRNA(Asn)/Glu-tRNA(Gln) amidotransferase A subunit family amidase